MTPHHPTAPNPTMTFLLDQGSLYGPLITPILDFDSPWLDAVNQRVLSGATPAFSTNRSVNCKCVHGRLAFQTSLLQAVEGMF